MKIINRCNNILFIFLFLIPFTAISQQDKMGAWFMYFGLNRISDKFSIHTEIQYRNYTFGSINTEQLLLRTGLNYHFSKKAFITAGYAFMHLFLPMHLNLNKKILNLLNIVFGNNLY